MQRVGTDSQTLSHLPLLGLLVVYESLSTVYPYLPPLFGFFMALLVAEGTKKHMLWVLAYFLFLEFVGFLMGVGFHSPDYLFVAYYILVEIVLAVFFL